MTFQVGDEVIVTKVIDGRDDCYGYVIYARAEERLVIREVRGPHTYIVSKVQGRDTFWAYDSELELHRGVNEDLSSLAYSIRFQNEFHNHVFDSWDRVAKILREFKKKKHKGFYLEVEELCGGRGYRVKVFKETT